MSEIKFEIERCVLSKIKCIPDRRGEAAGSQYKSFLLSIKENQK
ncbi:hypothetical protein ACU3L3_18100 [Priestia endophytica]|jgi:hypothetical protein|uniref:Uncharacterized protein n=1 Tax=Priestia endophytica DSM 13796 TaxID=1121089 RepID=A0A1I5Z4W1_9BACI|nr:hypothetical protein SAMN02745910_01841 [Priestia endophytica DSM 13796]